MAAKKKQQRSRSTVTAVALTIAGSDSSAGAGAQADLKTFGALGVYGEGIFRSLRSKLGCFAMRRSYRPWQKLFVRQHEKGEREISSSIRS